MMLILIVHNDGYVYLIIVGFFLFILLTHNVISEETDSIMFVNVLSFCPYYISMVSLFI